MVNRDKILRKNVSFGVLFKTLNIGIAFFTIPFLLKYLNTEQYGLWVTIFSIVNVIIYIDGGIGNGLKTKLSEAISRNELKLAREYISTAYFSISIFSLLILIIGFFIIYSINLKELLNTTIDEETLKSTFFITLLMMTVGYILGLYKSLFYASQKSFIVELSMLIYQGFNLLLIILVLNHFKSSLIYVALIYGISTILIGVFFSLKFFKTNKQIAPSLKFFKKRTVYDLFGLSIDFFIIQLCMIIIFSTDNIIISKLLGPIEVASYDVVLKLFQVIITFTIIIQDPFWALYSDAFEKNDFNWIKKTIKTWNILFIPFLLFVLMLIYFAKSIIKLWLQYDLEIQQSLILFMGIFVIVRVYGIIYMYFLNGIGKIKLQLWLYVFGAVINIPLSIYFVKYMNLGSSGVILGTIFSMLALMIFLPIQSFKILNQKDKINVQAFEKNKMR